MGFKIDKVYTKSGDKGETGLVGGSRVPKDSLRIESYGTVDELNSVVGMIRTHAAGLDNASLRDELLGDAARIQQQLFNLGSELACPPEVLKEGMPVVAAQSVLWLEGRMDAMSATLTPLTSFILPGGGQLSGWSHIARTVCRRAERIVVALRRDTPEVRIETVHYLNRLSDYFFVLARYAARHCGEQEYTWDKTIQ